MAVPRGEEINLDGYEKVAHIVCDDGVVHVVHNNDNFYIVALEGVTGTRVLASYIYGAKFVRAFSTALNFATEFALAHTEESE